jgi:hypothetical protein
MATSQSDDHTRYNSTSRFKFLAAMTYIVRLRVRMVHAFCVYFAPGARCLWSVTASATGDVRDLIRGTVSYGSSLAILLFNNSEWSSAATACGTKLEHLPIWLCLILSLFLRFCVTLCFSPSLSHLRMPAPQEIQNS